MATNRINLKNILQGKQTILLPVLSGLLLIAAFPPFEQGYLAWFALLPLLTIVLTVNPRKAFWAGFIFGVPLHFYLNFYLTNVLFPYLSTTLAVAAIAALVLYISLFNGLFALGASLINRTGKTWFIALATPSLWLFSEYLRSLGFTAYNVGYLGYTQWGYPTLLNIASQYGYWGLPFLMVFFQVIILLLYRKKLKGPELGLIAGIFLFLLSTGLLLPDLQTVQNDEQHLSVALIQGNSNPDQIIDSSNEDIVQLYLTLTATALNREPDIELVVWPETVAKLNFSAGEKHHPLIVQLAEEHEVSILYGARIREGDQLFNSITLFTPGQEEVPVYKKHRLVPFVEYFPLDQLLNRILELDLLLGSYTAGEEITVFQVGGNPVGGAVCFESYFGDHTRLIAAKGSRHLFVATNDNWFGESIGLELHAQAAAIRAAEMGSGVTQVANSGITISFDHRGRELFRSGKNEAAIFTLPLDLITRDTFYVQFGDYFPIIWIVFLLITVPYHINAGLFKKTS